MSSFITPFERSSSKFYITEPVVDMRESPTRESKVVSQTIFSENITLENKFEDWAYITTPDQYSGWIPANSFVVIDETYNVSLKVSRLAAHIYGVRDTEFGPIKTLPYGSQLQSLDETDSRWIKIGLPDGKECYIQKGDVTMEHTLTNKEDLVTFSQKFLGLPYTWGGRSSFGYDCSGFIQMLYSQIGIPLQRDSNQQVKDRRFRTVSMSAIESGDLIFFGKSEEKISHVGMYLGNGQFIHSTVRECQPWIRVSHLSDFEWSGHIETSVPYRIVRQLTTK
jgi:uncharacterized protein YgiM (DUF1202 family)